MYHKEGHCNCYSNKVMGDNSKEIKRLLRYRFESEIGLTEVDHVTP